MAFTSVMRENSEAPNIERKRVLYLVTVVAISSADKGRRQLETCLPDTRLFLRVLPVPLKRTFDKKPRHEGSARALPSMPESIYKEITYTRQCLLFITCLYNDRQLNSPSCCASMFSELPPHVLVSGSSWQRKAKERRNRAQ